jgi:hypothetical protein
MKRALYLLIAAFVVAVPALMASALLWHFDRATVFDTLPVQSDEMMYWHQAGTFAEAGFDGGHYTASELLPRVGRFYSWGAAAPIFYGTFAAVFGWPLWAMTAINLALLMMAVAAFIWLARLSLEGLLWLGAILATFHPFLIYSPTQYIEVLNLALALLLAGLFARLIRLYREGAVASRGLALITGAVIFFAALIRFPWAMLYLPLLLLVRRPATLRGWLANIAASVPLMIAPVLLYSVTSAPYPETIISRILNNPTPQRAWRILSGNFNRNMRLFTDGDPLEIQIRMGAALAAGALTLAIVAYLLWRSRSRPLSSRLNTAMTEAGLAWYVMAGLVLFIVVIYDIHGLRGYRMLSGAILFVVALSIAFGRRWLLVPLLVYQLAVFPYALTFYDNFTNFQTSPEKHARYSEYQPQLAEVLVYDPDAGPWCNTVLFDLFYLLGETSVMVAVPHGFGLSITEAVPEGRMPDAPQSAYIALRDGNYDSYRGELNLEPVLPLPEGMLYRNLDADCASTAQ